MRLERESAMNRQYVEADGRSIVHTRNAEQEVPEAGVSSGTFFPQPHVVFDNYIELPGIDLFDPKERELMLYVRFHSEPGFRYHFWEEANSVEHLDPASFPQFMVTQGVTDEKLCKEVDSHPGICAHLGTKEKLACSELAARFAQIIRGGLYLPRDQNPLVFHTPLLMLRIDRVSRESLRFSAKVRADHKNHPWRPGAKICAVKR